MRRGSAPVGRLSPQALVESFFPAALETGMSVLGPDGEKGAGMTGAPRGQLPGG